MENKLKSLLFRLGISDNQSVVPFFSKVRDRDDVSVLKCNKSGVIFLSRSDHMEISHYEAKQDFRYWGAEDRKAAVLLGYDDTKRRAEQFRDVIVGKKWIDIGTGAGGVLDLLSPVALEAAAVEPQDNARKCLIESGYTVYPSVEGISSNDFEVVTLFHVFEHLIDPVETLDILRKKMLPGAKIIIEVPHAKDFLISFLDCNDFKSFTFWSEHLILHTRDSLRVFLEAAGFTKISIKGYQRYPLANHLHWLAKGMPGGHLEWHQLRTAMLDTAYSDMLAQIDNNDTLIAIATNGIKD